MLDLETILGQDQRPTTLTTVERGRSHKVAQVIMVRQDGDGMLTALEVVSPLLKGSNSGQEFAVMGFIANLRRDHLPGVEGHRMPLSLEVALLTAHQLRQNGRNGEARSIRLHSNSIPRIEVYQNWSLGESVYEGRERSARGLAI